jgi:transposase
MSTDAASSTSPITPPVLPTDPQQMRELAQRLVARDAQLTAELAEASKTLVEQQQQLEKLGHELSMMKRMLYGSRRERFRSDDPRQQTLFEVTDGGAQPFDEKAAENEVGGEKKKHRGHGRRPLPQFLPRKRVEYPLPPSELGCPGCGQSRQKISQEVSEQLEYVPASLFVIEHVQFTYACPCCQEHVATGAKPPQPIPKGIPGPGFLAHVIADKYFRHLPLYRQEDDLVRYGILIRRSTLAGWLSGAAQCLQPLVELMKRLVLSSHVLGTDDTHVPMLDPELDHTRRAHFWGYVGDDRHRYVVYDFTTSRKRDGPSQFLENFHGVLQADAFSGYDAIYYGSQGNILEAGCSAHARRKFFEAKETSPALAHHGLAVFQRLYAIEDEAKALSANARLALRQEKSVPILSELKAWLAVQLVSVRPKSPIRTAMNYCLRQWNALTLFTTDGEIPIDNNRTERMMRNPAMGRKAWLFVGSERGGHTAATLYTLVASAKRNHLDPEAYLRDVLTRLPAITNPLELRALLPDRWAKDHPEHVLQHRRAEAKAAANHRMSRRQRRRQQQERQQQQSAK